MGGDSVMESELVRLTCGCFIDVDLKSEKMQISSRCSNHKVKISGYIKEWERTNQFGVVTRNYLTIDICDVHVPSGLLLGRKVEVTLVDE